MASPHGALAGAGFHAIAPDQRGYGASARPKGVAAYDLDRLVADVVAVIDGHGADRAHIIGHDWGAVVAWWIASTRPESVESLIAMAAGHPAVRRAAMRDLPDQRRKSRYVAVFQIPLLPELVLRAGDFSALARALSARKTVPSDDLSVSTVDLVAARASWGEKGALTAMINWCRALMRRRFAPEAVYKVQAPTLMIWDDAAAYGVGSLAKRSIALCIAERLVTSNATHFVKHDEPEKVADLVLEALRQAEARSVGSKGASRAV